MDIVNQLNNIKKKRTRKPKNIPIDNSVNNIVDNLDNNPVDNVINNPVDNLINNPDNNLINNPVDNIINNNLNDNYSIDINPTDYKLNDFHSYNINTIDDQTNNLLDNSESESVISLKSNISNNKQIIFDVSNGNDSIATSSNPEIMGKQYIIPPISTNQFTSTINPNNPIDSNNPNNPTDPNNPNNLTDDNTIDSFHTNLDINNQYIFPNVDRSSGITQFTTKNKKLTYIEVEKKINEMYNNSQMVNSTTLDILAIYLKGQKILFTEAKSYCEQKLNLLMLPAIFISAASSVLVLILKNYYFGSTIIAVINALNSFILALISFLKLDAKAEAHKTSAYKFDKLQALCEFRSGKILLLNDEVAKIIQFIEDIEKQVKEIKETNQFILPEYIRYKYNKIYSTNIFSLVKEVQNGEDILINQLKININNLVDLNQNKDELHAKLSNDITYNPQHDCYHHELSIINHKIVLLQQEQNKLLEDIIEYRSRYLSIDTGFQNEVDNNITDSLKHISLLNWLKS